MASICAVTDLRCHAIAIATHLNRLTTSILGLVDRVLEHPPTFRQSANGFTRRVWGPFRADQLTLRVEMTRTPDNIYVICLHGAQGELARRPAPEEFSCESEPSDFGLTTLLRGAFIPGPISNSRAQKKTEKAPSSFMLRPLATSMLKLHNSVR
ncbi:MAG: hypothetical protein GY822_11135 [Deltaproteobacteria bacterium]|nr:hypothetical protein [Deltaproteobacteria bacterium]